MVNYVRSFAKKTGAIPDKPAESSKAAEAPASEEKTPI
jgi:hypothetical protein